MLSEDSDAKHGEGGGVTQHSPTQVLKDFDEIRSLQIELPNGELGIEDRVLFFQEDVEFFDFMGFLCVCFPRKFLGLWVAGDWVDTVFMGLFLEIFMVWFLGFIFLFFWI